MKRRVVVLQHGSHGSHKDMGCIARCLRALDSSLIIWEPRVNEGFKTDKGVVSCGASFAQEVMRLLDSFCHSSPSPSPSPPAAAHGDGDDKIIVQLSFVGHSMGGLIVREALPRLFAGVADKKDRLGVEWKLFCSIGTPHGGTCGMAAFIRSYLGRFIGRVFSTSYHDMFLQSSVLTKRLLSPAHLACLAAFERRVLVSSINDLLVPLMSSGFMLTPAQRSGKNAAVNREEEAAMCACTEEEIYTKQYRIVELCEKDWPLNVCPVERRIAMTILQGAGPFDSIVVDFRSLVEEYDRKFAKHAAHKLSHSALVCKDPINKMGLEDIFGFVPAAVARIVAASYS